MGEEVLFIYCPDCRGKFEINSQDLIEDEICECPLCAAEIKVVSIDPIKLKLFVAEDDF